MISSPIRSKRIASLAAVAGFSLGLALIGTPISAATDHEASPSRLAKKDRYCPKGERGALRTISLKGLKQDRASRKAKRHDCLLRVIKLEGEHLAVTDDFRTDRVNVNVRDGRVKRIRGVY